MLYFSGHGHALLVKVVHCNSCCSAMQPVLPMHVVCPLGMPGFQLPPQPK